MRELSAARSVRLLGSVSLGRLAFSQNVLPTIRPVNHLVNNEGDVIIRSHPGAAILSAHGQVVAYEADAFDPASEVGWSVIVVGKAHVTNDPDEVARYARTLRPWMDQRMDYVVRVHPAIITGYEIVEASAG